jgi:hypothetical protein
MESDLPGMRIYSRKRYRYEDNMYSASLVELGN